MFPAHKVKASSGLVERGFRSLKPGPQREAVQHGKYLDDRTEAVQQAALALLYARTCIPGRIHGTCIQAHTYIPGI